MRASLSWLLPAGGVIGLVLLVAQLGLDPILLRAERIGPDLGVLVLLFGAHEGLRALALAHCLTGPSRPPLSRLFRIRLLGEAARALTHGGPIVSEPSRAWLLQQQGLSGPDAWAGTLAELTANVWISALMSVAILAATLWAGTFSREARMVAHVLLWTAAVFAVVASLTVATRTHVIGRLHGALSALPLLGRRVHGASSAVRGMEDALFRVLHDRPRQLARIGLIELVAQAVLVLEIWWALRAMGVSASAGTSFRVDAFTKVANTVQLVGATEGAYVMAFGWLGLPVAAGITLALVKRIRSLVAAAVGLALVSGTDANGPARPR